jgi:hypothetical protein
LVGLLIVLERSELMGRLWTLFYTASIMLGLILVTTYVFAAAGTPKSPSEDLFIMSAAGQIKALIGILILLLTGNLWWIRRWVNGQERKWETNWEHHRVYDDIKSRHDQMMELSGHPTNPIQCASPPIKNYSIQKPENKE